MSPWIDKDAPWTRWAFGVCAFSIALLGVAFRSAGYFDGSISLWLDEVKWLDRLQKHPITAQLYRPIGYMWLSRALFGVWSSEAGLRFFAYLPSLLVIPLVYGISTRVFRSRITVLVALFVFSLHPALIAYAKEFKPYSAELCVHLALVWLTLRQLETGSPRRLALLLAGCAAAPLLAYNAVFLFPSIVLAVGWDAWRRRDRFSLGCLAGAVAALLAILLPLQQLLGSALDLQHEEVYWGRKYGVFSLAESPSEHLGWLLHRYLGLVRTAGITELFWGPRIGRDLLAGLVWGAQGVGLLGIAVGRRHREALLFVLPLVVTIAFNALGIWPFGPHRTNLFAFTYVNFISLLGLDAALGTRWTGVRGAALLLAGLFALLQLPLDPGHHSVKPRGSLTYHSEMRRVLQTIRERELARPEAPSAKRILVDFHSHAQILHYLAVPPASTPEQAAFFQEFEIVRFGERSRELRTAIYALIGDRDNRGKGVWVVISKPPLFESFRSDPWIRENTRFERDFHGGNLLLFVEVPAHWSEVAPERSRARRRR